MPVPPKLDSAPRALLARMRMVVTDVDGTLTREGVVEGPVTTLLGDLASAGIEVLPVSGRPAGELTGLCRYLPGVRRGIAENGLLLVVPDRKPEWFGEPTDTARLREIAAEVSSAIGATLRPTADAYCRLGDVTYEREGRGEDELLRLRRAAIARGVHLIWSTVHIHFAESPPDKGVGVLALLGREGIAPQDVVTIGDAPNDGGLFVAGRFGLSVGTADVGGQLAFFEHPPAYLSDAREAGAFVELAQRLLRARSSL